MGVRNRSRKGLDTWGLGLLQFRQKLLTQLFCGALLAIEDKQQKVDPGERLIKAKRQARGYLA